MIKPLPNPALLVVAVGLIVACIAPSRSGGALSTRSLTIYARVTHANFLSHTDDRIRGNFANPFNVDTKSLPPATGKSGGSLPGDEALFTFKLYSDPSLKKAVGSATYTCTFNFAHYALCEADFEFGRGALIAAGPADFNKTQFTLAVTTGTGEYRGVRGQVQSSPASENVHRLDFLLG